MPPDPIEYKAWDEIQYTIKESMEPEAYDPVKPVPYIADMTPTGVMTIGWDRTMTPPMNFTVIPQVQVAVRSWND